MFDRILSEPRGDVLVRAGLSDTPDPTGVSPEAPQNDSNNDDDNQNSDEDTNRPFSNY